MDPNEIPQNVSNPADTDDLDLDDDEIIVAMLQSEQNSPGMSVLLQHFHDVATGSSSGNRRNKKRYINRHRDRGEQRIMEDYFTANSTYTDAHFRRRFRMRKSLFLRIVDDLSSRYPFFQSRMDNAGRRSFSPIHRCTAVIRMLAYGCSADMLDETVRMAESTLLQSLRAFVKGIREIYGATYLRRPNSEDIARLLRIGEARGFPGMLGSIDCMHWEWKNCPTAWHGQFTRGDIKKPTIILEAVASHDLWIWHAFFGVTGSNNDLNVLNQSDLFTTHLSGEFPTVQFEANGHDYNLGYYLADGIYPEWAVFVKTITLPHGDKEKLFAKQQEGARKDVERAFGVLQARFAIIRGPIKLWDIDTISDIMYACIILHNMIVEDERDQYNINYDNIANEYEPMDGVEPPTMNDVHSGGTEAFDQYILQMNADIHNRTVHRQLQQDLLEHMWQKFGGT